MQYTLSMFSINLLHLKKSQQLVPADNTTCWHCCFRCCCFCLLLLLMLMMLTWKYNCRDLFAAKFLELYFTYNNHTFSKTYVTHVNSFLLQILFLTSIFTLMMLIWKYKFRDLFAAKSLDFYLICNYHYFQYLSVSKLSNHSIFFFFYMWFFLSYPVLKFFITFLVYSSLFTLH